MPSEDPHSIARIARIRKELSPFVKGLTLGQKTPLLNQGDVCEEIFFIKKGCLRSWHNDHGNDITFQFFLEGSFVSSFESLRNNQPCLFNIETLTPVVLEVIHKKPFFQILENSPNLREDVYELIFERFYHYQQLFLSRITKTPQRRYEELLRIHPEIFERVPQHYIASYLGITPVSLSRIKKRSS